MSWRVLACLLALAAALPARADRSAAFDYYVLALSWSPEYCAREAQPGDTQCARPYAFVVHGLWPQHERGLPRECARGARLDETLIERMLPLMPSKALVIHQWRKHGVCSGLAADDYFATTRRAYEAIRIPARYRQLDRPLRTDVRQLEADLVAANPGLAPRRIAIQCSGRHLREVRVCLTPELAPRDCGAEVDDRCGAEVWLRPTREP